MTSNPWWHYLDDQLRERKWTVADLSRASGVSQSRIGHWRDTGAAPSTKNARAVAAALGVPLLFVLVEAQILTSDEAMLRTDRRPSLEPFSVSQLLREVQRRYTDLEFAARDPRDFARELADALDDQRLQRVTRTTRESANPLHLVADSPSGERLRDQQERAWITDEELPGAELGTEEEVEQLADPDGPEGGA